MEMCTFYVFIANIILQFHKSAPTNVMLLRNFLQLFLQLFAPPRTLFSCKHVGKANIYPKYELEEHPCTAMLCFNGEDDSLTQHVQREKEIMT